MPTIEASVGESIRNLRNQKGWSLRKLSGVCGLSANAISRIERGENSPTISSLHCLSTALDVPITYFFHGESDCCVFTKKGQGLRIQNADVELESLGSGIPQQQIEPFRMSIDPGMKTRGGMITHPGQEFIYCIEGELNYQVKDNQYHLQAGDSLFLDASQPHAWNNPFAKQATILIIFQSNQDKQLARQRHLALE